MGAEAGLESASPSPLARWPIMPLTLSITIVDEGELTLVVLGGELDLATMPSFRAEVMERCDPAAAQLVLDLSRVAVIDSPGLGALLRLAHRAQTTNRRVGLVTGGNERFLRLLRISHLEQAFALGEDLEAVRSVLADLPAETSPGQP